MVKVGDRVKWKGDKCEGVVTDVGITTFSVRWDERQHTIEYFLNWIGDKIEGIIPPNNNNHPYKVGDRVMFVEYGEAHGDKGTVMETMPNSVKIHWDDDEEYRYYYSELDNIAPVPWYPDDSEDWVEVSPSAMKMPEHLKGKMVEVLVSDERKSKMPSPYVCEQDIAENWDWGFPSTSGSRIVAYKIVSEKEHPESKEAKQKRSKYHKEVKINNYKLNDDGSVSVFMDVYDVIHTWKVTNPGLQHLIKKALQAGDRGHKDLETDMQDIIDSAIRAKELL